MRVVVKKGKGHGYWDPLRERKEHAGEDVGQGLEEECVICMAKLGVQPTFSCPYCKAIFHYNCIDLWLKKRNTCPLCYREIILS